MGGVANLSTGMAYEFGVLISSVAQHTSPLREVSLRVFIYEYRAVNIKENK